MNEFSLCLLRCLAGWDCELGMRNVRWKNPRQMKSVWRIFTLYTSKRAWGRGLCMQTRCKCQINEEEGLGRAAHTAYDYQFVVIPRGHRMPLNYATKWFVCDGARKIKHLGIRVAWQIDAIHPTLRPLHFPPPVRQQLVCCCSLLSCWMWRLIVHLATGFFNYNCAVMKL